MIIFTVTIDYHFVNYLILFSSLLIICKFSYYLLRVLLNLFPFIFFKFSVKREGTPHHIMDLDKCKINRHYISHKHKHEKSRKVSVSHLHPRSSQIFKYRGAHTKTRNIQAMYHQARSSDYCRTSNHNLRPSITKISFGKNTR